MAANIGLHYVQSGNFAAAKPWFERSLRLEGKDNPIARNYLQIVNTQADWRRLPMKVSAKLNFPPH